ncbi:MULTISPECIES: nucleoside-diphosphate sugar epimerase/dehydratase [unclassified Undibacterium]|uniref:polysaccharide biosynthesis protein n=1 Tax=unclassified Undibacterium TaxID=2630295 RepID=UPI002AC9A39D|nr:MULTISPECIES: nucleoside-diphosphate sugar epimerase/dehydratase [unclassified Undibacterium]MEB0139890.1 nucleoside-diphosphate sugar epimerase/dehydratase [Undibacterium sp. CCC2.1]MEB0171841.1 nucleoside-diphosphate sugar epimerase/dehydratase [Undibacterium sp. CCC1.1]MEB0175657.1 nucleoside-diphosphate sugar epimerase/dehydratase [Undibacterium sp. CCC3.4]MEB0216239.1 nucleoside-diphosphate sugar epimerase/dehydratase [Undibacterium sp. 5I2]WPX44131.1 nucleoside-diphosphate sugar epime
MLHSLLHLKRWQKQALAAALDALCLPLCFIVAIWLRYETFTAALFTHYFWLIVSIPLVSIPIYLRIGLYRAVVRFIDQKIISVLFLGASTSVLLLAFISVMLHIMPISRAIFAFFWAGSILYLGASRFLARAWLQRADMPDNAIAVCIYGAGKAGAQLAGALRASGEYACVAFVDDNKHIQGSTIAGIKVYSPSEIDALLPRFDIRQILLALPSISKIRQKQILDQLEHLKIKIKVTPSIQSLVNGELRVQDVRDVEIEDLLGRDQVDPDERLLALCIRNKHVMVTGAGGSIGSELCRQILRQRPKRLVLLEMSEYALYAIEQELQSLRSQLALDVEILPFLGSVLAAAKLDKIFAACAVDTLYHAAAYKHVPLVEHNPAEGIRNNVFGTLATAEAAMRAGVKNFVLISTDKAVRPTNVMGTTKRLAELILQACARRQHSTRFCMVRFGNVLGSSGSVVPLFRKQIMAGGPITLTHPEITRYFMTIPEAAQLVLQAGAMGEGGDVFVLDMGEPVRIIDLARRMVHLSGLEVKTDSNPKGTIEIEHVGLRPGEKLYEELLIGDNVEGTSHPLIMRARESEIAWEALSAWLQQLQQACDAFDYQHMRQLLMQIVTEYQPQCGIEDLIWQATAGKVAADNVVQLPVSI